MTPEQRQEEISKAYVHAVAAACGYAVGTWSQDHGGIDATIGAATSVGHGTLARPKVDVQLKATTRQELVHDEYVSWKLEMPHYDSLRAPALAPHLLVVLVLPSDADDSVVHTPDELIVRRCAYWLKMTGQGPESGGSKTVRLPRSQVFSPQALREILEKISRGKSDEV